MPLAEVAAWRSSNSNSQPKTSKLRHCRQKAEDVIFQLCHIFIVGEVCLHRIFRASYGNQLEVNLIAILGGRHCYVGAWFA